MADLNDENYLDPTTGLPEENNPPEKNPFLDALRGQSITPGSFVPDGNTDISKYRDELGSNIFTTDSIASLNARRAETQSEWTQVKNGLLRLSNIVPGVIGGLASTADIPSYFDSADTSNWLTDLTNEWQESVREVTPIHKENPNQAFDMGDPAWWIEGGSDLIKSAAEFMIEGAILGGGITKGISAFTNATKTLNKAKLYNGALKNIQGTNNYKRLQDGVGTFANAYVLNHVEATMEANDVYNQTLNNNIANGMPIDKAKELAGKAAATTSQINKVNILLNLTSAGRLLKKNGLTRDILKAKNLINTSKDFALEGGQEALEELNNHVASKMGTITGQGKDWSATDVYEVLGEDEAWASAFWGALGGVAQTGFTNTSERVRKTTNEAGEKVTLKQAYTDKYNTQQELIDSYKSIDAKSVVDVLNSIEKQSLINAGIVEAQSQIEQGINIEGNQQKIKELNDATLVTQASEAFKNGTTEKLIAVYEGLRDSSQTSDMADDYKEKAQAAIDSIEKLETIYQNSSVYLNSAEVFGNRAFRERLKIQYDALETQLSNEQSKLSNEATRIARSMRIESFDLTTLDLNNAPTIEQAQKYNEFKERVKTVDSYIKSKAIEENLNNTSKSIDILDAKLPDLVSQDYQKKLKDTLAADREKAKKEFDDAAKREKKAATKAAKADKYVEAKNKLKDVPAEFANLIDKATTGKELDSILDQMDASNIANPDLLDKLNQKRTELTTPFVAEIDPITALFGEPSVLGAKSGELTEEQIIQQALAFEEGSIPDAINFVQSMEEAAETSHEEIYTDHKNQSVTDINQNIEQTLTNQNADLANDGESYEYRRSQIGSNLLAFLSREFTQFNKDGTIYREDANNVLLDTPAKVLLSRNKFIEGTAITITPTDDISIEVNNPFSDTNEKTTWGAFKEELFKRQLPLYDYIPMVVSDENGSPIAHIHSLDWINPTNVVQHETDAKTLSEIRKHIFDNKGFNTTIIHKTPGVLIKNAAGLETLNNAFPDENLQLVVGRTTFSAIEAQSLSNLVNVSDIKPGLTYVIIPVQSGKSFAMPIKNEKLNDSIISSVTSAIDIFFIQDKSSELRNQILEAQGLDILSSHGLKKYITQFVYNTTVPVDSKNLQEYQAKNPQISSDVNLINITAGKNNFFDISFGKGSVYLGNLGMNSFKNKDGSLKADDEINKIKNIFKNKFTEFLKNTYINVNNDALNKSTPIIGINAETGDVDILASDYKSLIRENTTTNYLSFNVGTDLNPEYVYTIQPKITFDTSLISGKLSTQSETKTNVDTKTLEQIEVDREVYLERRRKVYLEKKRKVDLEKRRKEVREIYKTNPILALHIIQKEKRIGSYGNDGSPNGAIQDTVKVLKVSVSEAQKLQQDYLTAGKPKGWKLGDDYDYSKYNAELKALEESTQTSTTVKQGVSKLFDNNDKELKKGSVVEYNGNKYLFWNDNNGKAQLINADGTKFSGTPNIDKLTVLGGYATTMYNNTEYIVTDNDNVYSGATGKLVYTGKDNSSITQKNNIINHAKKVRLTTTQPSTSVKQGLQELFESNPELANSVYSAMRFEKGDNLSEKNKLQKIAELNRGKTVSVKYDKYKTPFIATITGEIVEVSSPTKLQYDDGRVEYKDDGVYNLEIKSSTGKILTANTFEIAGLSELVTNQITLQQKQEAISKFQEYVNATGKQDIKGFKEFVNTPIFDKQLAQKIQDKLEKLYPEIKLNITNNPVWEYNDEVFNQLFSKKTRNIALATIISYSLWNANAKLINSNLQYKDDTTTSYILKKIASDGSVYTDSNGKIINKNDTINTEAYNFLKALWQKAGYPKIIIKTEKGKSRYNPITNSITINTIRKDDVYGYIEVKKDKNGDNVYGISADLFIAEIAHGLQAAQGKMYVGKQIIDFIKSGFIYDNSYEIESTLEYEAHEEIEPQLVKEFENYLYKQTVNNKIIGQANIKAGTVLIDAIKQKQDTLPHEYAHHYIAWFRNTPIVQEAIKKWGSEEALVQSIGEQVIAQKGEALNWWNKFVKWITDKFNSLSKLEKQELTQILTDAFLTRQDLGSKQDIKGFKEFVDKKTTITQSTEAKEAEIKQIERDKKAALKEVFGNNVELIASKNETVIQRNGLWGVNGKDYKPQTVPTTQIFEQFDKINAKYDAELKALEESTTIVTNNKANINLSETAITVNIDDLDIDEIDIDLLPATIDSDLRDSISDLYISKGISFRQQHSTIKSISNALFKELVEKGKLEPIRKSEIYNFYKTSFEKLEKAFIEKSKLKAAEHINEYLTNWDKVINLSEQRIKKFAGVKSNDSVSELQDNQGTLEKKNFEDGSTTFMLDGKDTTSAKLKMFLSGITTGKANYIGLTEYEDFDTIFENLSAILADNPADYTHLINILKNPDLLTSKPWMADLVTKLENADSQVKNEFVVAMTKHFTNMKHVLLSVNNGKYAFVIQDATSNAIADNILGAWTNNLILSSLIDVVDGEYIINEEEANKLKQLVNKYSKENITEEQLIDFFSQAQLNIPLQVIKKMINEDYFIRKNDRATKKLLFSSKFSPITAYVNKLVELGNSKEIIDTSNSPFKITSIKNLAKQAAQFDSVNLSNSHKVGENTIYSYTNNKYTITKARELLETVEAEYNGVTVKTLPNLTKIVNAGIFNGTSNKFLEIVKKDAKGEYLTVNGNFIIDDSHPLYVQFNIDYLSLDVIKELFRKNSSGKISSTTTIDHEIAKLSLFSNQYTTTKADAGGLYRIGYMFYPTMSDKTTMFTVKTTLETFATDVDGNLTNKAIRSIYDKLVLPELNRINVYNNELDRQESLRQSLKEEGLTDTEIELQIDKKFGTDIKGYKDGANKVLIIPEINDLLESQDVTELIANPSEVLKLLKTHLENVVEAQIQDWTNLKVIGKDASGNDYIIADDSYLNNFGNNIKSIATDYALNYMVHNMNMYQNFIGDPALYFKGKSTNSIQDSKNTFTNMGKRLAGDLAPGMELAWDNTSKDPDGTNFTVAFLNDRKSESLSKDYYKSLNLAGYNEYLNIEGTDAQEFITWEEHLRILRAKGEISQDDYTRIKQVLKKGESLKDNDIKKVLQPIKPVYVNNVPHNGVYKRIYIKSSAFPLIPQLTTGLEIDKLRVAMESNGVSHAVFYTAAKVGAPSNGVEIFEQLENGSYQVKNDIEFTNTQVLPRDNWRIQQEVPYKEDKDKVNTGTQERKLLFSNIRNINTFINPLTNRAISGANLETQYNDYYGELFKMGYERLLSEVTNEDKTLNIEKLSDVLIAEATDRGYSINDKLSLQIVNGKFRVPLWALASADKVESLLSSIVNNRVIKQKHTGKSYVLGTEEGFKPQVKTFEEAAETLSKYKSKVVWTSSFNESIGLLPHSVEDGKFKPSQIMVSSIVKDKFGKIIDVRDYATEVDGKLMLDETKIPKELLMLFGFRIPTQGLNSMMKLEIVGFLPPEMGDLMIASRDLTKQMGSDFDVDKLYTYRYNTYQTENGNIIDINDLTIDEIKTLYIDAKKQYSQESAIDEQVTEFMDVFGGDLTLEQFTNEIKTKQLQNKILDIHFAVLSNPDPKVQALIAEPLSFGDLKKEDKTGEIGTAKVINELNDKHRNDLVFSPSSALYQRQKFTNALAGKAGIGVFSLDSTLNAQLQGKNVTLVSIDENGNNKFKVQFGTDVSTGKLGNIKTLNNKKNISDVIAAFQSAAVDNENEQILDKLNINQYTFPVIKTLALLGFDENLISAFISQPIIQEYIYELSGIKSIVIKSNKTESIVKENLMAKYNAPDQSERSNVEFRQLSDIGFNDLLTFIDKRGAALNYEQTQAAILDKFVYLSMYGKQISKLQTALNTDSSGLDKSLLSINTKYADVTKIQNDTSMFISNTNELLGTNESPTIMGHTFTYGITPAVELFSSLLPYSDRTVANIFKSFEDIIGKDDMNENLYKQIFSGLKSYVYNKAFYNVFNTDINKVRYDLLIDDKKTNKQSLATLLNTLKKNELKDATKFKFIHSLVSDINVNGDPSLIKFNASKSEEFDEDMMYGAFIDLLQSNVIFESINMSAKEFAENLVKYALAIGGTQQANEFLKYIPLQYLENIGFTSQLNDLNFNNEQEVLPKEFIKQFFQHNPYLATSYKPETIDANATTLLIPITNDAPTKPYIVVEVNKKSVVYEKIEDGVFNKLSSLGYKQYVTEYNWGKSFQKSIFKLNESNAVATIDKSTIKPVKKSTTQESVIITDELQLAKTDLEKVTALLDNVSSSEEYTKLAQSLKNVLPNNVKLNLVNNLTYNGNTVRGFVETNVNTKEITINVNTSQSTTAFEQSLLHEVIHAVTKFAIQDASSKSYQRLNAVYSLIKKKLELQLGKNTLNSKLEIDSVERMVKNLEEFVAIALTDQRAQKILKEVLFSKDKALWEKLLQTLSEVLNMIREITGGKKVDLNPIVLNDVLSLAIENKKIVGEAVESQNNDVNLDDSIPNLEDLPGATNPFENNEPLDGPIQDISRFDLLPDNTLEFYKWKETLIKNCK